MFGILVDKNGFKVEFDMLEILHQKESQDGEKVIEQDWAIANGMNKPKWDGEKWIDTEPLPPQEPPIQEPDKIDILNTKIAFIDAYKHEARLFFDYGNCGGKQRFANEDILFINLTIDGMKANLTPTVKWKYSNGEYDIVTDVTYFETMKFIGGSLISKVFSVEEIIINELKLLDSIEELLDYDEKVRFDELFSIA